MFKTFAIAIALGLAFLLSAGASLAQNVYINSNFNGTNIPAGSFVYINSVINPSGLSTSQPTTINLTNASVTIAGTTYALPNATITYVPGGTTSSTTYDSATNTWHTTVPLGTSGNEFLTAFPIQFPMGLPGGASPVIFQGTVTSPRNVWGNVQFAAAVYTQMPTDLNQLGVNPTDGSLHAGTPENYKDYVTGGARGGGGSNYTGSYSSTAKFAVCNCTPTPTPTPTATPPPPPPSPTPPPPTPVPEPATIILLGSGLLGYGANMLRKRFGRKEEEIEG